MSNPSIHAPRKHLDQRVNAVGVLCSPIYSIDLMFEDAELGDLCGASIPTERG